jgi:hypothetical protein
MMFVVAGGCHILMEYIVDIFTIIDDWSFLLGDLLSFGLVSLLLCFPPHRCLEPPKFPKSLEQFGVSTRAQIEGEDLASTSMLIIIITSIATGFPAHVISSTLTSTQSWVFISCPLI